MTSHGGPSEQAIEATSQRMSAQRYGRGNWEQASAEERAAFRLVAGDALDTAHSPALGLDRSVCLRDVRDWMISDAYSKSMAEYPDVIARTARDLERHFTETPSPPREPSEAEVEDARLEDAEAREGRRGPAPWL